MILSSSSRARIEVEVVVVVVTALAVFPVAAVTAVPQEAPPGTWPAAVERALERAGDNRDELVQALREVPDDHRKGLEFLVANMPERDLESLSATFLLKNVALAYSVRAEVPWGASLPEEVFLNDVLPYANVNERRDDWRGQFKEKFLPLVKDSKTPSEAAQVLNQTIFSRLGVKYSTQRRRPDQSPLETIDSGLASCTGLSILLADACRAVGVPARLAGTPGWAKKRGNHTWVEIWDQTWHFTGACEPDRRGLDHAWFESDAAAAIKDSRRNAIYAASFKKTDVVFPLVWAPSADYVHAVNVTDRYTGGGQPAGRPGLARLMVRVRERSSGERLAVPVEVTELRAALQKGSSRVASGVSKDGSRDANDFLTFELPADRKYEVRAGRDGSEVRSELTLRTNSQVVDLYLESADPAAARSSALTPAVRTRLRAALESYFGASAADRSAWRFDADLDEILRSAEDEVRRSVWQAYRAAPIHGDLEKDFAEKRVQWERHVSPYTVKQIGDKPPDGWPLFIAMHGGGGTAKRFNDQQWRVMQRYYRDQKSVPGYLYLALRAPNDRWNGFYDDYVYPLVAELIRQFLIFGDVDPQKVFIMGYSHGGYGAFAIGPKIPDRFAAIHSSAAAPTDGESSPRNLRNTVFTFMIGERDHAYGRLERCKAFDEAIRRLRGERRDVYPVTMEYKAGFGHGGLPDRDKIEPMYAAVRNAAPRELTWELTDGVVRNFFWLEVTDPGKRRGVEATCRNNRIVVKTKDVRSLALYVDRRLVDFERPVEILYNGSVSTRRVAPSLRTLCESTMTRGDPGLAFTARVELTREF